MVRQVRVSKFLFTGLDKIKNLTRQSLNTRLQKSLSLDWIHPDRAHTFSLCTYYVQLEWQKKERKVFGVERTKLTSIHEAIEQINEKKLSKGLEDSYSRQTRSSGSSRVAIVLIEGWFILI